MVLRCGGRRDEGILLAVDMTMFEPGGGGAKDEICGAFDITILIILSARRAVEKEDVLVADDPAIDKDGPVATSLYTDGLARVKARVISDGDVLRSEVVPGNPEAVGIAGIDAVAVWRHHPGMVVEGEDGACLADKGDVIFCGIEVQLLPVGAGFDKDGRMRRTGVQCSLYGAIVPRAVRGNREMGAGTDPSRLRIGLGAWRKCRQEEQVSRRCD